MLLGWDLALDSKTYTANSALRLLTCQEKALRKGATSLYKLLG